MKKSILKCISFLSLVLFMLMSVNYVFAIEISNYYANITINKFGRVQSVKDETERELLREIGTPLCKVYVKESNKTGEYYPTSFHQSENNSDVYILSYLPNSTIQVKLRIIRKDKYFVFSIDEVSNLPEQYEEVIIVIFRLKMLHAAQREECKGDLDPTKIWAESVGSGELFIHALPLNINTTCYVESYKTPNQTLVFDYVCKATSELGLEGAGAALITAPKSSYHDFIEGFINDYNQMIDNGTISGNKLPYVESEDGGLDRTWFRDPAHPLEPYLFVVLRQNNYAQILNYAKKGGFGQILIDSPLSYGSYNKLRYDYNGDNRVDDTDTSEFRTALQSFAGQGINIGIHTFLNRIYVENLGSGRYVADSLYDSTNLNKLFKVEIALLAQGVSSGAGEISLDTDASSNEMFKYYNMSRWYGVPSDGKYYFCIGNEIIRAKYQGRQLIGCERGVFGTTKNSHSAQEGGVYILPRSISCFFIAPNSEAMNLSADSFATFINDLSGLPLNVNVNVNFIYADNECFIPKMEISDKDYANHYVEKYGLLPYLNKIYATTDKWPMVQFGGTRCSPYAFYYKNRAATGDGVVFKNKENTKLRKVNGFLVKNSLYNDLNYEMGWWKINGAKFGNSNNNTDLDYGKYDFDATSFDDVNYAMSKVLAYGTSIGLQLHEKTYRNLYLEQYIEDLFYLIGRYHRLIREGDINESIKEQLRLLDTEAELKVGEDGSYNLIRKKVDRQYACWQPGSSYSYDLNNPFNAQKLKLEIRPRFDYYAFDDTRHTWITDFASSSLKVDKKDADISCVFNNNNTVTITNNSTPSASTGSCTISFTKEGNFNLTHKRGLGLWVNRAGTQVDGKYETIFIRLFSGDGYRDYRALINFSGEKYIVLGDPEASDNWRSHWVFDYSNVNKVTIEISNIQPGATLNFSLKALEEKGYSELKNPCITVNNNTITSNNVTLKVDDTSPYLLEYDGNTKTYKLYTSNYEPIVGGTGRVEDNITIQNGTNSISVSSDTTGNNSTRAEVKISVYEDSSKPICTLRVSPSAPSELTASTIPNSSLCQITLNWKDNSDNEQGFKIERSTGSTGAFKPIGSTARNVVTYTDTKLSPSTTYYYRVCAYNDNEFRRSEYTELANANTPANQKPSVGTITLSVGNTLLSSNSIAAGQAVTFTTTYTDPNGWWDIQNALLLIHHSSVKGYANACYVYYNQNTNKLYILNDALNDAGTAWNGGFAPFAPNEAKGAYIANSQAILNCTQTKVTPIDNNTLKIEWNITFKSNFRDQKTMYLRVKDDAGVFDSSWWVEKGTLTIR